MLFFVQAYEKNLGLDEIHIYNRWISFSENVNVLLKKIKKWKERSYLHSLQFITPQNYFPHDAKLLNSHQILSKKGLPKKIVHLEKKLLNIDFWWQLRENNNSLRFP